MNTFKSDADYIKSALSPADFYRYELPTMPLPKGGGWQCGGLCPFHDDRKKGSFRVNLDSGAFACFSCDTKGGDIISFIQAKDGLSFLQAIKQIRHFWGV